MAFMSLQTTAEMMADRDKAAERLPLLRVTDRQHHQRVDDDSHIGELRLCDKTVDKLEDAGIETVGDIREVGANGLIRLRAFGLMTLIEIYWAIRIAS